MKLLRELRYLCVVAVAASAVFAGSAGAQSQKTSGHLTLKRDGNALSFTLSFPVATTAFQIVFSPTTVIAHDKYGDLPGTTVAGLKNNGAYGCTLGGGSPNAFNCNASPSPPFAAGSTIRGTIRFSKLAAPFVASAEAVTKTGITTWSLHTANASF